MVPALFERTPEPLSVGAVPEDVVGSAWNKMADATAHVAMDCQRSLQTFHPSDRPEWRDLDALLPGDFARWQTAT
jgi:hypothetical protein